MRKILVLNHHFCLHNFSYFCLSYRFQTNITIECSSLDESDMDMVDLLLILPFTIKIGLKNYILPGKCCP